MMTRPAGFSVDQRTDLQETRQRPLADHRKPLPVGSSSTTIFVAQPWQDATLRALSFSGSRKSQTRRNWHESGDHGGNFGRMARTRRRWGPELIVKSDGKVEWLFRLPEVSPRCNDSRAFTHCRPVAGNHRAQQNTHTCMMSPYARGRLDQRGALIPTHVFRLQATLLETKCDELRCRRNLFWELDLEG